MDVEYKMLAQGEYNINFCFEHPLSGEKFVLRVNTASQMHLQNQAEYEYNALELLKKSGRTPAPLYVDASLENIDYGIIVMHYLKGLHLDYRTDMHLAAKCLADIHSIKAGPDSRLIAPSNPLESVIEECHLMIQTYYASALADPEKVQIISRMLERAEKMIKAYSHYDGYRCCINTELNSTNFLINGEDGPNYLIDWEKPLYGDPAQDIGHFLAPTTTFWKTDVILEKSDMDEFIENYEKAVASRFDTTGLRERVNIYVPINCLRGITWCAMAWVEYKDPKRLIVNESTRKKLDAYMDMDFLKRIEREYFMEKGYVHIYTGNGKGKTTAAFGLALRAAMSGKKVYIGQFVKGMAYEETKCTQIIPEITIEQFGTDCFIERSPGAQDIKLAKNGLEKCIKALSSGNYDLVIMDEITIAIYFKLLTDQEVLLAIDKRKYGVEVVLTGRYASEKLMESADLVSEIKELKHYFNQGVLSRKGIDC